MKNPTAEAVIEALREQLPTPEFTRMKQLLTQPINEAIEDEEAEWHAISLRASNHFFEEEECLKGGDVVTGLFAGAQSDKSWPAIVVSSDMHAVTKNDTDNTATFRYR